MSVARYHVHELDIKMAQTDTQIEATSIKLMSFFKEIDKLMLKLRQEQKMQNTKLFWERRTRLKDLNYLIWRLIKL